MKLRNTLLAGCILTTAVNAQTWDGSDSNDWNTGANWVGDAVPDSSTANIVFNGTDATPTINVSAPVTVNTISYNTDPNPIEISGSAITFGGTSSNNILGGGSAQLTINNDLVLSSGQGGNLNVNVGGGSTTFNGVVSGTLDLRKVGGNGSLILGNSTNTFTGDIKLEGGNISIADAGALGNAANTIIWSGSTFQRTLQATATTTVTNDIQIDNDNQDAARISVTSGNTLTLSTNSITRTTTAGTNNVDGAGAGVTEIWDNTSGSNSTVKFTGNALTVANNIDFNIGGNSARTVELANASGTQTWNGELIGSGNLVKSGAGDTVVNGDNTYSGATTIEEGTLFVNGTTSGQGAFTVDAGATLAGDGTIGTDNANVTINGALSAGNSPGTLTMDLGTGILDVSGAQDLVFELGTASDLILLSSGTLDIGSGTIGFSDFTFSDASGLVVGDYTLFDTSATITGTLDAGDLSGAIGAFTGTLGFADGGNDLILTVVPEPSSYALISGALALAWIMVRRRR